MKPALTIAMPHYNHGEYVKKAIDSVIYQDFCDYELVIMEDGSRDQSPEILQKLVKNKENIRCFFYKENKGILPRMNEGISLARGKYIHFMAADDYHYPSFLQKSMELMLAHPEVALCFSQYHFGEYETQHLESCGFASQGPPLIFEPKEIVKHFQTRNFNIPSQTAVIKTEVVKSLGGFDEKNLHFADWFLLNKVASLHKCALIREPLTMFVVHGANYSNVYRKHKKSRQSAYRYLLQVIKNKEHREFKTFLRKTGLLHFVFKEFFWRLLINPHYWSYWPYVNKKYSIKKRLLRSVKKKLGLKIE